MIVVPPVTLSVAPGPAPSAKSWLAEITPASVAVPVDTWTAPRPSRPPYKPSVALPAVMLGLTGLDSVTPLARSIAAPCAALTAIMLVAEPRAELLAIRSTPASTRRPPVSTWAAALGAVIEEFQAAGPAAASTSVPLSALITWVVAEALLKGAESVSVLPPVTSKFVVVVPVGRRMSRAVLKVPVPRRPVPLAMSTTPLAALPSAPSLPKATLPPATVIGPVKSFVAFWSQRVPAPAFVIPKLPVTWPVSVRPWTTFEALAVLTVKVGMPESVVVPVNWTP